MFDISVTGCDSAHTAVELIQHMVDAQKATISRILSQGSFSVLSDGSQARKTGCEKELVFVRVLHKGAPVYFVVALQDMDSYGAVNAENLKQAIDDVFMKNLKLSEEHYLNGLVCAAADGAAVNTGNSFSIMKNSNIMAY